MNWQFLDTGRFSLYAGAGGMIEKCVSAKFGSRAMDEPGVQWSVLGAAGAQYDLGGLVGLYFEPEVSYYFTETDLRTVSLFAAGSVTGGGTVSAGPGPGMMMSDAPVGGGAGTMAQLKYNYDDYSFKHHQPLSFGLSVRKEFAHGLSLESGVNYTLLWANPI